MTYTEARNIIIKYANEMTEPFSDRFQRFPEGGCAVIIANYLQDRADYWYDIDKRISALVMDVAIEIIIRGSD